MKQLLEKFRIPVSDVIAIPDVTASPSDETKTWFDSLINNLIQSDNDHRVNPFLSKNKQVFLIRKKNTDFIMIFISAPIIKESELMALTQKTLNYMRLRELLLKYSTNANLVVM